MEKLLSTLVFIRISAFLSAQQQTLSLFFLQNLFPVVVDIIQCKGILWILSVGKRGVDTQNLNLNQTNIT